MAVGLDSERLTEANEAGRASAVAPIRRVWRIVTLGGFSSLTRRIVFLNLFALAALVASLLVLNQSRDSLIDAEVRSLTTQGELIANAISASATLDRSTARPRLADPDMILQLEAGGAPAAGVFTEPVLGLDFQIDPVQAMTVLRYLLGTEGSPRVRIYGTEGIILLDSQNLNLNSQITRFDLPPPETTEPPLFDRIWTAVTGWFGRSNLPIYEEYGATEGRRYAEVANALGGERDTLTRLTESGQTIVSVAVPISNYQQVQGALLLTSQPGDIDAIIAEERNAILRVFAVAAAVSVVLSLLLAGTIAAPLRRLAEAADAVRKGVRSRPQIPDFTKRRDEIGHLSQAFRDMTAALYNRIEAIEHFAADVAHEIKNPLTSLRSAVETMPLAKTPESRERLIGIIQHDVRRLDRLITDISDASRLDAELGRWQAESVDISLLLATVVGLAAETTKPGGPRIVLEIDGDGPDDYLVMGHDTRLGQVFNNLIDNARSFSPPGTRVLVTARRDGAQIEIAVEDQGPGIKAEQVERVFERFYTDRPEGESFGQNSGLGLSISKQIVEAHHGRIWAENLTRPGRDGTSVDVLGARFVVRLPAAIQ